MSVQLRTLRGTIPMLVIWSLIVRSYPWARTAKRRFCAPALKGQFMAKPNHSSYSNKLLRVLSAEDHELIRPHLEAVELERDKDLEEPYEAITHAYFLESGIASTVGSAHGSNEKPTEVGLIGREGVTALALILGSNRPTNAVYMQVAGSGHRIAAQPFREAMASSPTLHGLLLKFIQVFLIQISQTAVSNGRSNIEQRLARWLLMTGDRVDSPEIALTHEFISVMLGVRRAGVTEALHALVGRGLIQTERSQIRIIDRDGLEINANGCYGEPEREYRRLIPNTCKVRRALN
jgi:CRP-like cAMP-binding protein